MSEIKYAISLNVYSMKAMSASERWKRKKAGVTEDPEEKKNKVSLYLVSKKSCPIKKIIYGEWKRDSIPTDNLTCGSGFVKSAFIWIRIQRYLIKGV